MNAGSTQWVAEHGLQFVNSLKSKKTSSLVIESCQYSFDSAPYTGNVVHLTDGRHYGESPLEVASCQLLHTKCSGSLLIAGLGTGLALRVALDNPKVERVVVLESSEHLVDYILKDLPENVEIQLVEDLFTYESSEVFNWGFIDLWTVVDVMDLTEVYEVRDRFSKFTAKRLDAVTEWFRIQNS